MMAVFGDGGCNLSLSWHSLNRQSIVNAINVDRSGIRTTNAGDSELVLSRSTPYVDMNDIIVRNNADSKFRM